ncbi:MAG: hypothetical protein ACTSP4_15410 [Candidatus Hodarchaeales archaeon]
MKLANSVDLLYKTHASHYSVQQYNESFIKFPSSYVIDYLVLSFLDLVTSKNPCCSVVVELESPVGGDTYNNSDMRTCAFKKDLRSFQGVKDYHGR